MFKRQRILLSGLAILVLLGLLVSGAFRSREPEYGGRKLSQWVEEFGCLTALEDPNQHEIEAAKRDQAAIQRIGTNGVPYLLRWFSYRTPSWKKRLDGVLLRIG